MSETDDKEKAQGDAEFLRSKLHVEWGYYDEVFVAVPKMPLIQAGFREPPFEVKMWNGLIRRVVERKEGWPTWRCGICGKQPCDGHGHDPVPVGEL